MNILQKIFNPEHKITEEEQPFYDIFIALLLNPESKIMYIPISDKWILISKDEKFFFILSAQYIKFTNHNYYTEKRIDPKFSQKLNRILEQKVEKDRLKYEEEISLNFQLLVNNAIKELNNENTSEDI